MANINFTKMNGAGNDFILIDKNQNLQLDYSNLPIQHMCDRRIGIGADGVLIIEQCIEHDFKLKYYNADGSLGSLCGNGSRCSIYYAYNHYKVNSSKITFSCNDQIYSGQILNNDLICFDLNVPSDLKIGFPINYNNQFIKVNYANTGSPHVVIFWSDLEASSRISFQEFDMLTFGRKIRFGSEFSPEGTNVNLLNIEKNKFYIRTYERGVENETLSCGTGTVAAAMILNLVEDIKPPIELVTRGNNLLKVDFMQINKKFSKITLTGPAKFNYIGSYNF